MDILGAISAGVNAAILVLALLPSWIILSMMLYIYGFDILYVFENPVAIIFATGISGVIGGAIGYSIRDKLVSRYQNNSLFADTDLPPETELDEEEKIGR